MYYDLMKHTHAHLHKERAREVQRLQRPSVEAARQGAGTSLAILPFGGKVGNESASPA